MMDLDFETALFYGFIALVVIVVATIIGILIHAGLLIEVIVDTCKPYIGEVKIAYKFATGPYKEAGALFTEVHTLLPHYRTLGVYYDDPKKKEASRLRYIVGLILSENDNTAKEEEERLLKEYSFKFATFPAINHAVQTSFPFNSTLSIIVAIYKVYPVLVEYIAMKKLCAHPFIEVYDNDSSKIMFIGPLEKQDDFYVPEVKMEQIKQGDEEDNHSTASWDDSASLLRNDIQDFDSDSIADDSSVSISNISECQPPSSASLPQNETFHPSDAPNEGSVPADDDSDHTGSSFEEIDEKDISVPKNDASGEEKAEL